MDIRKIFFKESDWANNGPSGKEGRILTYAVALVAEKGSEQLDDTIPITFTDIFDNNGINPTTTNTARLYTWGAKDACRPKDEGQFDDWIISLGFPYGEIDIVSGADEEFSVTDSGDIACIQGDDADDTTFDSILATITDADLSGDHVPTNMPIYYENEYSLDDNYIASYLVDIWVPKSDLEQIEFVDGTGYQIDSTNIVSDFDPISITGQSNYGAGVDELSNNSIDHNITDSTPSGGITDYSVALEIVLPEVSKATPNSVVPVFVFPDETVTMQIRYMPYGGIFVGQEQISCTKTDLNKAEFIEISPSLDQEFHESLYRNLGDYYRIHYGDVWYQSFMDNYFGADQTWCTGDEGYDFIKEYVCTGLSSANPSGASRLKEDGGSEFDWFPIEIEYSTKDIDADGEDMRTATCNDDDGPWYSDATSIPNGMSSVTRIRMTYIAPDNIGQSAGLVIDARVEDSLSYGDRVGFFSSSSPDGGVNWYHSEASVDDTDPNYAIDTTWHHAGADRVNITTARARTHRGFQT